MTFTDGVLDALRVAASEDGALTRPPALWSAAGGSSSSAVRPTAEFALRGLPEGRCSGHHQG
jgi:hypothetical protein